MVEKELMYSFIVPVYNVEQYLEECLDSIIDQKSEYSYEVLIVNDGSTDGSEAIAKRYVSEYSFVKLINKKNGGLSSARNAGIKAARGKWLVFVDSDDYISKEYLQEIDKYIVNISEDEILTINIVLFWEDGTMFIEPGVKRQERQIGNMMYDVIPTACSKIVSRKTFTDNKLRFSENIYYEDVSLFPQLAALTGKYRWVNKDLYYYRQRENSISHDRESQKMMDAIKAIAFCKKRLEKFGLYETNYKEFEFYSVVFLLSFMCPKIIENDYKSIHAKKMLAYVERTFPDYRDNVYLKKLSLRNRAYLYLVRHKKFRLLNNIINVKSFVRNKIKNGCLNKLYLLYRERAI